MTLPSSARRPEHLRVKHRPTRRTSCAVAARGDGPKEAPMRLRVLIFEDEPSIRKILWMLGDRRGYEVLT